MPQVVGRPMDGAFQPFTIERIALPSRELFMGVPQSLADLCEINFRIGQCAGGWITMREGGVILANITLDKPDSHRIAARMQGSRPRL
jgi:hypothetical protein